MVATTPSASAATRLTVPSSATATPKFTADLLAISSLVSTVPVPSFNTTPKSRKPEAAGSSPGSSPGSVAFSSVEITSLVIHRFVPVSARVIVMVVLPSASAGTVSSTVLGSVPRLLSPAEASEVSMLTYSKPVVAVDTVVLPVSNFSRAPVFLLTPSLLR